MGSTSYHTKANTANLDVTLCETEKVCNISKLTNNKVPRGCHRDTVILAMQISRSESSRKKFVGCLLECNYSSWVSGQLG